MIGAVEGKESGVEDAEEMRGDADLFWEKCVAEIFCWISHEMEILRTSGKSLMCSLRNWRIWRTESGASPSLDAHFLSLLPALAISVQ